MRKIITAAAGLVATAVLFVAPAVTANAAPAHVACIGCILVR